MAPNVVRSAFSRPEPFAEGLQRNVEPDLVSVLETVGNRLGGTGYAERHAVALVLLDPFGKRRLREMHEPGREACVLRDGGAPAERDPDLVRILRSDAMEPEGAQEADNAVGETFRDHGQRRVFGDPGIGEPVEAAPDLLQQPPLAQPAEAFRVDAPRGQLVEAQHAQLPGQSKHLVLDWSPVFHVQYSIHLNLNDKTFAQTPDYPGANRSRWVLYRNRRIGEFLKELDMTEGRATGIPKIIRAMRANGSPPPEFDFDEDHTYFLCRLLAHPQATMPEGLGENVTVSATPTVSPTVAPAVTPAVLALMKLLNASGECGNAEVRNALSLKDRGHMHTGYLLIERNHSERNRKPFTNDKASRLIVRYVFT